MYLILKRYGYFTVLFWLLSIPAFSWAVTIKIINSINEYNCVNEPNAAVGVFYQVQIGNQHVNNMLTHSFTEEDLIESGHRNREVRFSFFGFGDGDRESYIPTDDLQERIFRLLTNDPNTFITDEDIGNEVTCFQLFHYLVTGITNFTGKYIKQTYSSISSGAVTKGQWVALVDNKMKGTHVSLYLGNGIYMSKIGANGIYFHKLETIRKLYEVLSEFDLNAMIVEVKKKHEDQDPPAAGACCGTSLQSAY